MPCGIAFDADTQVRGRIRLATGQETVVAVNVDPVPPPAFLAIAGQLAELAGGRMGMWKRVSATACSVDLTAAAGWRRARRLVMRLSLDQGIVLGEVSVGSPGKGVGGWLGAAPPAQFRFTCPATEVDSIRGELERALRAVESGVTSLPVPAREPKTTSDTLPRPASVDEPVSTE
jgi:hypothetical protein